MPVWEVGTPSTLIPPPIWAELYCMVESFILSPVDSRDLNLLYTGFCVKIPPPLDLPIDPSPA